MGVALDSSFLIDLMRGEGAARVRLTRLEDERELVSIPTPVVYELIAGTMARRGRSESQRLAGFLSRFPTLPLDKEAAEQAAEIRAELLSLGREKPHVDVLIAGIALRNDLPLVTRDADFVDIAAATGLQIDRY